MAKTSTYKINAEATGAKEIQRLTAEVDRLKTSMDVVAGSEALDLMKQGFEVLSNVLSGSLEEFSKGEQAFNLLDRSLQNSHLNITAGEVQGLADNMKNLYGVSDDLIVSSVRMATSFKNINTSTLKDLVGVSADLSAFSGSGYDEAFSALAMAMEKPAEAAKKLKAQNIILTASETEQIKAMTEAGNVLGAQQVILDKVKGATEGLAAANAQTFAGSVDILKEKIAGLQENIGAGLAPAVKAGNAALGGLLDIASQIPAPIMGAATAFGAVATGVPIAVAGIRTMLPMLNSLKLAFTGMAGPIGIAVGAIVAIGAVALGELEKSQNKMKEIKEEAKATAKLQRDLLKGMLDGKVKNILGIKVKLNFDSTADIISALKKATDIQRSALNSSLEQQKKIVLEWIKNTFPDQMNAEYVYQQKLFEQKARADRRMAYDALKKQEELAKEAIKSISEVQGEYQDLAVKEAADAQAEANRQRQKQIDDDTKALESYRRKLEEERKAHLSEIDKMREDLSALKAEYNANQGKLTEQEKGIATSQIKDLENRISFYERSMLGAMTADFAAADALGEKLKELAKLQEQFSKATQEGTLDPAALEKYTQAIAELSAEIEALKADRGTGSSSAGESLPISQEQAADSKARLKEIQSEINRLDFSHWDEGISLGLLDPLKEAMNAISDVVGSIQGMIGNILEMQNNAAETTILSMENELSAYEKLQQGKIDAAAAAGEDTTALENEMQNEIDRRQQEINERKTEQQRREFENNKAMATVSAIVSGANAVLSALATPPFPVGLVMSGLAAGVAATNIALIQSQQFVPQLAEGGIVSATPGGRLVNVAEAGQDELIAPVDKFLKYFGDSKKGNTTLVRIDSINGSADKDFARRLAKEIDSLNRRNAR